MTLWKKAALCVTCGTERPIKKLPKPVYVPGVGRVRWACVTCNSAVVLENKRGAKPTRSIHTGAMFPSKEESRREPELLALARAGVITDLRAAAYTGEHQTERYRLEVYSNDAALALAQAASRAVEHLVELEPHEDRLALARELERCVRDLVRSKQKITTYRPDYSYVVRDGGRLVVEDVKASLHRQQHFREKCRLMAACHNIDVQAVRGSGRSLFGKSR